MRAGGGGRGGGGGAGTVYLKPKKKVPAPAPHAGGPAPANFSSGLAPLAPPGSPSGHRAHRPGAQGTGFRLSPQPRFRQGTVVWPGCPPPATLETRRRRPSAFKLCWELVVQAPRKPPPPSPGSFRSLRGQKVGLRGGGQQAGGALERAAAHWTGRHWTSAA